MNTKEAYEQKIQAQVDEWDSEILKLKAQAAKTTAEVQINMNNQIKELRKKKESVNEKFTQLKEASEDSWEDLKAGIEEGLDLLRTGSSGLSVLLGIPQYHEPEDEVKKPKNILSRFDRFKKLLSSPSLPLKRGREKKMENEKYSTSKS